jgi:CHAT domain-containing protein
MTAKKKSQTPPNFSKRIARAKALFDKGLKAGKRGDFKTARKAFESCVNEYQILVHKGQTHLQSELATTRMNLALCLADQGELASARTHYETTLNEFQSLIAQGRDDLRPELALTRVNLASCLYSQGELSLARTHYETTLDEYQSLIAQGRDDLRPELAGTRVNLASCLYSQGELSLARTHYETTLNEYQSLIAQGRDDLRPDLATTRMNLANCLDSQGELSLARTHYEATLNEFQRLIARGRDDLRPELAGTRMNLAVCLANQGELSLARTHYETTLNEYQRLIAQGRDDLRPELAKTRMNLANCLANQGELSLARTHYETTLNEYESLIARGRDDLRPDLALTRMNLAVCLYSQGELSLARTHYETTLNEYQRLIAQGRDDLRPDLAKTQVNLASCLSSQGELSLARTHYETTLNEYQRLIARGRDDLRPELALTRMNLAVCLYSQGELSSARTHYETTLDEYQRLIAQGRDDLRPNLATTRMSLASCLSSQGELSLARTHYETTLNEYQRLIAQGRDDLRPYLVYTRINLASCLEEIQDFPACETHYQTAFELLQSLQQIGQLFPDVIKMIILIADWYRHPQRPPQPDKSEAFNLAQLGLNWLDELLNLLSDAATNFMLTQNLPLFQLASELALELNQPDQAYLILERSKSRVLVEQMLRERAEPGSQVDKELRDQYHKLRQQLRQLVNQLNPTATDTTNDSSSTRLFAPSTRQLEYNPKQTEQLWQAQQELEQQLARLRQRIQEQDSAFAQAIQPQPLRLEQVTALIAEQTLVIAFEQGPDFLRLYPLTVQGVATPLQLELSLLSIYEQAVSFQHDMRKYTIANHPSKLRKTITDITDWLNAQLSAPFTQLIEQYQPQQLIFIPHVAWHLLPIHLVELAAAPLAWRYPVQYLPSMQILRLIADRGSAQQQQGCIIANPTKDLGAAELESQTVFELRGQIDHFLGGQQANLATVRHILNDSQHGHFSCHGIFNPDLSQAGLSMADGLLPALEMFTSIRLDNPRLVVMSACETAQVEPTLADEYMGLSSSFLFAGAHNVLATLWPVEDNASRLLIENFYQNINAGLSLVEALKQAQQQIRQLSQAEIQARSPNTVIPRNYEHPYYWAGFVLIGDGK